MKKVLALVTFVAAIFCLSSCSKNAAELTEDALVSLAEAKENADSAQDVLDALEDAVGKLEKAAEIAAENPQQAAKDMSELSKSGRLRELKRSVMNAKPKKNIHATRSQEEKARQLTFRFMKAVGALERYAN